MLGSHCCCRAVQTPENDPSVQLPRTHVVQLGRTIDDMIDGLHSEVDCHELDDWGEAHQCRSTAKAGEPTLSDGGVPESVGAMLVDEPLRDLVGSVIVGDFLPYDEDVRVSGELLVESLVESLSIGQFPEIAKE